jgi:hypothetical protein
LVGWLVGNHLLLMDFEPYGIIFMDMRVIITVIMVMLLRKFGYYGIIFTSICAFTTLEFPVTLDGQFTSIYIDYEILFCITSSFFIRAFFYNFLATFVAISSFFLYFSCVFFLPSSVPCL